MSSLLNQPLKSTAPPLSCGTHPAQRPSITRVGEPDARDLAHQKLWYKVLLDGARWEEHHFEEQHQKQRRWFQQMLPVKTVAKTITRVKM